ncbi:hypothetical protein AYI70_g10555 [Smittium culicis]|uniref:Uncharacterized protein n=1 Tax=Smittium culicis TaxID=133412 RepID=A0A1R1X5Z2_9FUNG|nr:hypothetical protein AYI70_g10555 [Smittium culicis]
MAFSNSSNEQSQIDVFKKAATEVLNELPKNNYDSLTDKSSKMTKMKEMSSEPVILEKKIEDRNVLKDAEMLLDAIDTNPRVENAVKVGSGLSTGSSIKKANSNVVNSGAYIDIDNSNKNLYQKMETNSDIIQNIEISGNEFNNEKLNIAERSTGHGTKETNGNGSDGIEISNTESVLGDKDSVIKVDLNQLEDLEDELYIPEIDLNESDSDSE